MVLGEKLHHMLTVHPLAHRQSCTIITKQFTFLFHWEAATNYTQQKADSGYFTSGNTKNIMQWCDIKRRAGRKSNHLDTKLSKPYLASCHCRHRASLLSGHSSHGLDCHSWLCNRECHRPLLSSTCHTHSTPGSVQTDWLCTCHVLSSY